MKLSWDMIHTFDAVAKTGSLLAAAKTLRVSQPTVGRRIDLLEEVLGVTLFVRSRDGMALTDAGVDLVETSGEMVRMAGEFERRATDSHTEIAGTVRLSVNDILGIHVMPDLLREFMETYPDIQVELEITNAATNLLRRDADVAVRMFRPVQSDLIARKAGNISLGFYASKSYLKAHGRPKTFADLKAHRQIGFDRETFFVDGAKALGETVTASDYAFRCDNILAQIEAVKAGLGIGVLHQGLAARFQDLEQILPQINLPEYEIWVACHSEVRHNKRIRLLVDFLAQKLRRPYA